MDRDVAYAIPNGEIISVLDKLYYTPGRHWHLELEENPLKDLVLVLLDGSRISLKKFELRLKK